MERYTPTSEIILNQFNIISCLYKEKIKGKGNIDTTYTLNNIGIAYKKLGDYRKALEYYSQSLKIK